jgi:hypothetical protein
VKHSIDGVVFDAPAEFVREETMVSLRVPASGGAKDPRIEHPVRPNLVVHRRPAAAGSDLARIAASTGADLARSLPGLSPIESVDLIFADGVKGLLLAYSFPAPKGLRVCQLQALRLDGGMVTSLTVSTEQALLTDAVRVAYVRALASASVAAT